MEISIKRFAKFILGTTLSLSLFVSQSPARAYNVGDVIGKILSTDIAAYINDSPVVSYNIAGRTAIVVQQLQPFGFEVLFDEAARTLTVKEGAPSPATANIAAPSYSTVGDSVGDVYFTDISTNFNGQPMESFNIGGLTCVYADDFAQKCGSYVWDEGSRTVKINKHGYQSIVTSKTQSARTLGAAALGESVTDALRRWGAPQRSNIIADDDGGYTAIEAADYINIEKYDAGFNLVKSFSIAYELPIFGAFYSGKDFNYIVFGQENLQMDNSREVLRLVIYDKNFVKVSEVPIANCKTTVPFDATNCAIAENDGYIVIHTGRSQYKDENGQSPQTQLTVIIDKKTWSVVNMLGKYQPNHTSHALNQFAVIDGDKIITADMSDAAPYRGAILRALDFSGNVLGTQPIFSVGGAGGANCTGIMTGGMAKTDSGYIVTLNALDPSLPTGYNSLYVEGVPYENRDVYALFIKKDTWEMKHTCLARYTYTGKTAGRVQLASLSDGRLAALWQVFENAEGTTKEYSESVAYAILSPEGELEGNVHTMNAALPSDGGLCVRGNKLVWYVNTEGGRTFYTIDVPQASPASPAETKQEENPKTNTEEKTDDKIQEVDGI